MDIREDAGQIVLPELDLGSGERRIKESNVTLEAKEIHF
jgi:hypothetical protein